VIVGVQFFAELSVFILCPSVNVSIGELSVIFVTSTIHCTTIVSVVLQSVLTQKIVHLTAAVLSVVYTSKSEPEFRCVAFVQIVPAHSDNFTRVFRLSSFGVNFTPMFPLVSL
jgi:hypothetical protein